MVEGPLTNRWTLCFLHDSDCTGLAANSSTQEGLYGVRVMSCHLATRGRWEEVTWEGCSLSALSAALVFVNIRRIKTKGHWKTIIEFCLRGAHTDVSGRRALTYINSWAGLAKCLSGALLEPTRKIAVWHRSRRSRCLFVDWCLTSQQQVSVSQGRIQFYSCR